jgi:hypothetical protein
MPEAVVPRTYRLATTPVILVIDREPDCSLILLPGVRRVVSNPGWNEK